MQLPIISPAMFLLFTGAARAVFGDSNSATSLEARAQPAWSARNLATIQKIYNLTVYPHNVPILKQGSKAVPPGLFNKNATGRVSPVGNFSGFDDSIEYFFALAPTPQEERGIAIYDAEVVAFTSGCANVASSLVYLRTGTVDPKTYKVDMKKPRSTLSQVGPTMIKPQLV